MENLKEFKVSLSQYCTKLIDYVGWRKWGNISYQENFSVVCGVDEVTVQEKLELDVARVAFKPLKDLPTNWAQRFVGVSEYLEIVDLTTLIWKPVKKIKVSGCS